jgi:hypothetical protein
MSINSALSLAYDQLSNFAGLENFWNLFDTAFGSSYDFATAASFRSQWQSQDFSLFPQIEVVSGDVLGSAKGAYAISTNKIYLSDQFVSVASQQSLEAVILEEFGHFVDAQVNATDTPGDEGELFSALVRGVNLSAAELSRIQTENDQTVISVDGRSITVEQSLNLVGVWDRLSYANAIAIAGNYAYAVGETLEIIDISNPAQPVYKSNYDVTTNGSGVDARDIKIVGNYAYVAGGTEGLKILDISNPTTPILKFTGYTYSGYAYYGLFMGVDVVGNYAYVAVTKRYELSGSSSGLIILDISDPTTPILQGYYNTGDGSTDVKIVGNYAYVADWNSGLKILDISNPTIPTLIGSYSTSYHNDVEIVGNYAYIAGLYSLDILDISNHSAPVLVSSTTVDGSSSQVEIIGNYAYIGASGAGLKIFDISNPVTPILKTTYDYDTSAGSLSDIKVVGNTAYLADGVSGVQILDITNPITPTLKSHYALSNATDNVQVVGNYAYVADGQAGLQIVDISNPSAPVTKGTYDSPYSNSIINVQVVGNYAYSADQFLGLQIIDISNPSNPTLKGSYGYGISASDIKVVGNYAYISGSYTDLGGSYFGGLIILDISDPSIPTFKGSYNNSAGFYVLEVVGNYAYGVSHSGGSGLSIIDISSPTTPILKSGIYLGSGGFGRDVVVVGNYAYVADWSAGLKIIDISNPDAPILKGTYLGGAAGVKVIGNYAYVAGFSPEVKVIDISDPTSPIERGSFGTGDYAYGVDVVGNYAYVAYQWGGVKIIDVSEFTNPVNQAPTNLALSNGNIAENQSIGTAIGTFTTTDPDTGNTFTYSLVTGTGSTDNALFTITGNQLQSNGIFDFETKNSYSIRVKTTDQGGLSYEKELTLGITNVDEQRSLSLTPQQDIFINEGLDDTVTGTFANLQQNDNINGGVGIDILTITAGTTSNTVTINASNITNQLNISGTTIKGFERFDLSGFLGLN